jgi:hypothetical protein
MGFNIAGIVVNKNYENQTEELGKSLGLNLRFEKEITGEEATSNWKDDGICDIYFAENGTILYLPFNMCATESYAIENQDVLTFAYSETSMAFNFDYYENGEFRRKIFEAEGDRMDDIGEPLPEEAELTEVSELIFDKIGTVLGEEWSSDDEAKAFRYKI